MEFYSYRIARLSVFRGAHLGVHIYRVTIKEWNKVYLVSVVQPQENVVTRHIHPRWGGAYSIQIDSANEESELITHNCTTEMEREDGDEGRRVNTNITFCTFVMDNYYPNYDLLIRECFWNNIFKLLVKSTYCFLFGLLYGITYFIMNREVSPLELSRKQVFNIRITAHYNRLQKNKLKWEYFYFGFVSSSCCIIKCWKVIEGNRRIFSTW